MKHGGTSGGAEASLAPMETAVTPLRFRIGMSERVMPGTSRWLSVVLFRKPCWASRANVISRPASIIAGPMISSWALCGKACHVMCPAAMPAVTASLEASVGQCKPMPGGQSKNMSSTHDWNMKFSLLSVNPGTPACSAPPTASAFGMCSSK